MGVKKTCGFGYDQVNEKYILLVVLKCSRETVTKVYTFGSSSWTTIQNFPSTLTGRAGKFVSGNLNWVAKGSVTSNQWVILSFDVEKETFDEVLLPEQGGDDLYNPVVNVLNNCICVSVYSNRTHWVVWKMEKYGVQEFWTKLMMITHEVFRISRSVRSFDPSYISEDGFVLGNVSYVLVLYNLKNGRLDYPSVGRKLGFDLHIFHESLISPRC